MEKLISFFKKLVFRNEKFILGLWIFAALAVSAHLAILGPDSYNNYLIFKQSFWHTLTQNNLYLPYPAEYFDHYFYGPLFSLVIAPFALLPDVMGVLLWGLATALLLYYAIKSLPLEWSAKVAIYYICFLEMITVTSNMQSNGLIAALILFSFSAVQRGKDFWAGLFIVIGAFIKLYGIVGLAFFFFAKNKPKYILGCIFWTVVCFILPMLITSPDFIIRSYHDWYATLIGKNATNMLSAAQDISLMGMIRRIAGYRELSNLFFIIPGLILFVLQYLKISCYKDLRYRLEILASTLLFVVLFSSGTESSGYIIAMCGVSVWLLIQPRPYTWWVKALLIFALIITSFSTSDLFPAYLYRHWIGPYALKALPCFVIWIALLFQLFTASRRKVQRGSVSLYN